MSQRQFLARCTCAKVMKSKEQPCCRLDQWMKEDRHSRSPRFSWPPEAEGDDSGHVEPVMRVTKWTTAGASAGAARAERRRSMQPARPPPPPPPACGNGLKSIGGQEEPRRVPLSAPIKTKRRIVETAATQPMFTHSEVLLHGLAGWPSRRWL